MDPIPVKREYTKISTGNFSVSEHVTPGNFAIYSTDFFLAILIVILNSNFFIVLLKTRCLHLNLRTILMNTVVANTAYGLTRICISTILGSAFLFDVDISSKN
ncbi:unnamed protein product [Caenorhabditis auriculariae]|uniref:Uncharacterized protein n=1 Tax=Caenorhabditis auriculariae TaxID=2777116 RepID=A0A8S1H9I9_9PELO|nr:unnamed protein product [Caenorhabditis auriculariae]